jgi:hypothetical protein
MALDVDGWTVAALQRISIIRLKCRLCNGYSGNR